MKYDLHYVVPLVRPGASYVFEGDDYSGLKWLDNEQSKPTLEELQAKVDEVNSAEPMRLLRIERNKRLAEVDWVTVKYYSQGLSVPDAWKNYTQALRDITIGANPQLLPNARLDLGSVSWPSIPSDM